MQAFLLGCLLLNASFFFCINVRQTWLSWLVWREADAGPRSVLDALQQVPDSFPWPSVAVLVPAHNEAQVIAQCLAALDAQDYPSDRFEIWVINDRSTDATSAVAHAFAASSTHAVRVIDRPKEACPGKPAAIADAMALVHCEVVVFFDADYTPAPHLVKALVQPFADPAVGATMGRVTPENTNVNLLTRLLDIERRAGYGVDQHGRQLQGWLPQFGGTAGGVRVSALQAVGGWSKDVLAEDTDLTYRLYLAGYEVRYLLHASCYEEAPQTWGVRYKQVRRWAMGHNQCLARHGWRLLCSKQVRGWARWDALFVLTLYLFPLVNVMGLLASLVYPVFYDYPPFFFTAIPALGLLVGVGNLSTMLQIAVAAHRDGQLHVLRVLPLLPLSSTISALASIDAVCRLAWFGLLRTSLKWDKTERFRQ
jgi:cellulose synthase/poly-beta-1,6-N-acetylglucosamine synthase-like glycosyltransferase